MGAGNVGFLGNIQAEYTGAAIQDLRTLCGTTGSHRAGTQKCMKGTSKRLAKESQHIRYVYGITQRVIYDWNLGPSGEERPNSAAERPDSGVVELRF